MAMTVDEMRAEYRKIRGRSHAGSDAEFDAKVCELVTKGGDSSPAAYLRAARVAKFPCRRCAGTGAFITYVENGQPKGPGGICYRCAGKGFQDDADARRNYGADIHQVVRM
jgi:hypothetical protein